MCQDGWSPFHCVNLGHKSAVDDTCLVKDLVAARCQYSQNRPHGEYLPCPAWMTLFDLVAYGIVFQREQSVKHLNT